MPIKIDIRTNISDYELTIEKCSEMITLLQNTYNNMRSEMYSHFLGKKSLKNATIIAAIIFILYLLTHNSFFIYLMPISVILSMISSIISAEYITKVSRQQIAEELQRYIKKREMLIKDQKLKA